MKVLSYFIICIQVSLSLFLLPADLHAQEHVQFDHLGVKNGLARSAILSIAEDNDGYIWFAGVGHVYKYNAHSIENYSKRLNFIKQEYISRILFDEFNNLLVGTGAGLFIYNVDQEKYYPQFDPAQPALLNENIRVLKKMSDQSIWIGTSKGLYTGRWQDGRFKLTRLLQNVDCWSISEDRQSSSIYVGGLGFITQFITPTLRINEPLLSNFFAQNPTEKIMDIHVGKDRKLYLGTQKNGLLILANGSATHITESQGLISNTIRSIIADAAGNLSIGTLRGLSVFNPSTGKIRNHYHDAENPFSLSQNSIYDLYVSKQGILWIGTFYGGVNMLYPNNKPFIHLKDPGLKQFSSNIISAIKEDAEHLWVATEAEGLLKYSKSSNHLKKYSAELSSNLIKDICLYGQDDIYLATYSGGINRLHKKTDQVEQYKLYDARTKKEITNVYSIYKDRKAVLWIGTEMGLLIVNEETMECQLASPDIRMIIYKILELPDGRLIFTSSFGSYIGYMKNNQYVFERFIANNTNAIYFEDNLLWIAYHENQLQSYDLKSQQTVSYPLELSENTKIVGLLKHRDIIWLSTDNGLYSYDIKHKKQRLLTVADGLPTNEFNLNSYLKDSRGLFYFGSLNGVVVFNPDEIKFNNQVPPLNFERLKIFDRNILVNDSTGLLKTAFNKSTQIDFGYQQNVFTIEFSVLNYINPTKNQFAYRLLPIDTSWNYVPHPSATYMNLPAGSYSLEIKGANNDGIWNNNLRKLEIIIHPPFWKTWWAYMLYIIMAVLILYYLLQFLIARKLIQKSEKDLQSQLQYYDMISHEIRTPLTLILSPIEQLIKETQDFPQINMKVRKIQKNTTSLKFLINELLDFKKIQAGKRNIYVREVDFIRYIEDIFYMFSDMALQKNLNYYIERIEKIEGLYLDEKQMEKVLNNLLSNAIKYSKEQGRISLTVYADEQQVYIEIQDNGMGIASENQQYIFQKFYREDEHISFAGSSGIGLSLSKEIVELHQGSLEFTSLKTEQGNQTTFQIKLPLGRSHFEQQSHVIFLKNDELPVQQSVYATSYHEELTAAENRYSVLIVEDNTELRTQLVELFSEFYQVIQAVNGSSGLQLAQELMPDLIISDVMMPELSGIELTRILQDAEQTAHIPIVLLTALDSEHTQIEGLHTGATAFIGKPYQPDVLLLTVRNLLQLSDRKRQLFKIEAPSGLSQKDDAFIIRLNTLIEDNFQDEQLHVDFIAREMGMSQPILYKKLKALSDYSVHNYIKSFRMETAKKLLQQGKAISETAYYVGYSDRKYFSKEFKRHFGLNPSAYLQSIKKE